MRQDDAQGVTNQVRRRRLAAGLSQQALAERAGITRQAIHAIESDRYLPNTLVALRLAEALGCSVEALFALPEAPQRLAAELVEDAGPVAAPLRVQVARVGERRLAFPLRGSVGALAAADGLLAAGRPAWIDLLIDPDRVDQAVVVCGCDPALALLGAHLSRRHPAFRLVWVPGSSLASLRTLGRGEVHAAGTHLRDPQSGISNLPYVARELPGQEVVVIAMAEWQQGLLLAPQNPKAIREVADLARQDVAIVNREWGAGSRLLLDDWLEHAGLLPGQVRGYDRALTSHLAAGEAVAAGMADAAPGILSVARALGLDFLPLQVERYDLVVPTTFLHTAPLQAMLDVAVSAPYRRELEALGGYDSRYAGDLVAELAS